MTTTRIFIMAVPLVLLGCNPPPEQVERIDIPEPRAQLIDEQSSSSEDTYMESSSSETMFYSGTKTRSARSTSSIESVASASSVTQVQNEGRYTSYSEGVIGNGQPAVLFFHAGWCPYCIESDGYLQEFYGNGGIAQSTYKIDYDTAAALKQRYGIVTQNTFVLIDGNGNAVKTVTSPTKNSLKELVQS